MVDLLLETELQSKQRHFVSVIHQSGVNLLSVINDVLDFSKIESGKLELESIDFNLLEHVEETVALFAEQAQRKYLELACSLPPTAVMVSGDPVRLRQILANLLGNAIKFTEHGEVIAQVSVIAQNATAYRLRFEIRDTGIGIPEEAQQNIFKAFDQADGSTTRKYGGTGLGLAIVKQLVVMMGGEVIVDSVVGRGSSFWFVLEFKRAANEATALEAALLDNLNGFRALIVDDNDTNREILDHLLGAWGMRADSAADGVEALFLLNDARQSGDPYAVALLDGIMPGMSGPELALAIRNEPRLRDTKLLLLTSVIFQGDQYDKARQAGVTVHLHKPVRKILLHKSLRKLLRNESSARSLSEGDSNLAAPRRLRFPGARILLVEDNLVNQEVARTMLTQAGCKVDIASNGQEAVDQLARYAYDVVLMDCQMPVMDGFQATAAIRARERSGDDSGAPSRLPIIAVTAHAIRGDRERCLEAGMDDYLGKPFVWEDLATVLSRWLPTFARTEKPVVSEVALTAPTSDEKTLPVAPAAMAPNNQSPVLDLAVLETIRKMQQNGSLGLMERLIDLYQCNTATLLEQLRSAADTGERKGLQTVAHTLKSSSANVGAMRMQALCKDLDMVARAGPVPNATDHVAAIEQEFVRVRAALQEQLAQEK